MKCCRIGLCAEVYQYEPNKGMEDGFELWSDVVTKGWIVTDLLVKAKREDGAIVSICERRFSGLGNRRQCTMSFDSCRRTPGHHSNVEFAM